MCSGARVYKRVDLMKIVKIHKSDYYYFVERDDGTFSVYRKSVETAAENPLSDKEQTIAMLCDMVMDGQK